MNTWSEDTEGLLPSPPLECDATPKAALGDDCIHLYLCIFIYILTNIFLKLFWDNILECDATPKAAVGDNDIHLYLCIFIYILTNIFLKLFGTIH